MLARVQSFVLGGIDAIACDVEVDHDREAMPRETVVGLPDAAVRESLERVKSALGHAGYAIPQGRTLINLAPADVRKEGPIYDLPIAIGMLIACRIVRARGDETGLLDGASGIDARSVLMAGELALDGRIRPIRGAVAMAALAKSMGMRGVIVPLENAREASVIEGIEVYGIGTLGEVVGLLNGVIEPEAHPVTDVEALVRSASAAVDFAEVRGQEGVKRAITIAAAGQHNVLMLGPPGTGKTMMARALPGVLPAMTADEAIEVTRIYSAAGMLDGHDGLIRTRPVRAPHHTASPVSIVGGGSVPRPGEVSLAHHGILFLDELPEFPRPVLETLRQPLEDRKIRIARARSAAEYPAGFMLVAAMNPTPKGDVARDQVSARAMDKYLSKLSGPLIDRIDIHVEVPAVPWKELSARGEQAGGPGTSSAQMREAVGQARDVQLKRQGAGKINAVLRGKELDQFAPITDEGMAMLGRAVTGLGLSARAYDKIRRVSRTIADLEGREEIDVAQIAEAVQYRLLDRSN